MSARNARGAIAPLILGMTAACSTGESPPAAEGLSVPFDLVRNQIVMQVMIGDEGPFNMLLDTAVNPSAVDLATAEGAGLAVDRERSGEASGTGNDRVTVFATEITGLRIGGREFEPIQSLAVDMTALGERLGRPLHGVLGYSFLSTRAVRIDYPDRRVHIFDGPAPSIEADDAFEMAMERDGTDVIVQPVYLDGHPLRVTLDTGSSLTLEVYGHAAERIGIDALKATADSGTVRGARGDATILTTTADSLRIGRHTATGVEITFPERDRELDGNLGNGFLKDFVLTVDYVAGRLILHR
jgi:predicted aspartyl protease